MKIIITILLTAVSIFVNAQAFEEKIYGGVFVYNESIDISSENLKAIDNAIVFVNGSVTTSGSGNFTMTKNSRFYYTDQTSIKHPYFIKIEGKVKLHKTFIVNKYQGEKIMLLSGSDIVYEGYVDDIPSELKVKRGVYDLLVRKVGYFNNIIIK